MPVKHVVLFKFKADTPQETMGKVQAGLYGLKPKLTGLITDISMGPTFITDRAQGYTHCLVVDLADKEALKTYAADPDHLAVIGDHIKPNLEAPPLAMDYEF